jgi:hypothetical protein
VALLTLFAILGCAQHADLPSTPIASTADDGK